MPVQTAGLNNFRGRKQKESPTYCPQALPPVKPWVAGTIALSFNKNNNNKNQEEKNNENNSELEVK